MIRYKLSFFLLLLCASGLNAQMFDSIQEALHKKPRFLIKLDSKDSFISNSRARMFGFKAGVDFNKQLRIGGGFYLLNSVLARNKYIADPATGDVISTRSFLKLGYITYFIEYAFYRSDHWEFCIPLQLGVGNSKYQYEYLGKMYNEHQRLIILYEPVVSVHYKFVKWAGIGADAGFRLMIKNNKAIHQNLNSPIYAFKLLLFTGEIYRTVFKKR